MAQRRVTARFTVRRTVRVTQTRRVSYTAVPTTSTRTSMVPAAPAPAVRAIPAATRRRVTTRTYTPQERALLDRVAGALDNDVDRPRDAFLCHAWADREGAAEELCNALVAVDVDVWFSERDVRLGVGLARQLDAGLRASRVGLVLVTRSLLQSLRSGGFADQELGALLATERVMPIVHGVSYDELKVESPLLAARAGLSTEGSSLAEVAAKIAESVLAPAA